MTPQEIEEVIIAKREGKQIQARDKNCISWFDDNKPTWQFEHLDYRVKPESKIRPYTSAEEFLEDLKIHGPYIKYKDCIEYRVPELVGEEGLIFDGLKYAYKYIIDVFTWQDGHPCGIIE